MIAADGWHIILTPTVHDELIPWRNFIASLEGRTMDFQDICPRPLHGNRKLYFFIGDEGSLPEKNQVMVCMETYHRQDHHPGDTNRKNPGRRSFHK